MTQREVPAWVCMQQRKILALVLRRRKALHWGFIALGPIYAFGHSLLQSPPKQTPSLSCYAISENLQDIRSETYYYPPSTCAGRVKSLTCARDP